MNKCSFCEYYIPKEGCFWDSQAKRTLHCLEAIARMSKALKNIAEKGEK